MTAAEESALIYVQDCSVIGRFERMRRFLFLVVLFISLFLNLVGFSKVRVYLRVLT